MCICVCYICICICICISTSYMLLLLLLCSCSFCAEQQGYQMRLHPGPLLLTLLKWSLLVSLLPFPFPFLSPPLLQTAVYLCYRRCCIEFGVILSASLARCPGQSPQQAVLCPVHKRRPQKEPKTMGDKGHSGRELWLGAGAGAGAGTASSLCCRHTVWQVSHRYRPAAAAAAAAL